MAQSTDYNSSISYQEVIIPSGSAESEVFYTHGSTVTGIIFPAEFDGNLVANFSASVDGGETFQSMHRADGEQEQVVYAEGNVFADYQAFARVDIIKIRVSSPAAADRTLRVTMRAYS